MEDLLIKLAIEAPLIALAYIFLALVYRGIDRKIHAQMQWRIGPPLRQPFYDVRKLLSKQNIVPENSIAWMFNSMPKIALISALAVLFYLPFGPIDPVLSQYGDLIIILYLLAIPPLAMALGGFASGSPYSTIGSQRELVVMMSYEFPLAITIATLAYLVGGNTAFSLTTVSSASVWSLVGPVGFIGLWILLIVILASTPAKLGKIPFDVSKAEVEVASGPMAEYSGRNLALFYLSDAVKTIAIISLVVAIFFPYHISPILGATGMVGQAIDVLFYLAKVLAIMLVVVTFVRTAFARLKIDQFSKLFLGTVSASSLLGLVLIWIGGL